MPCRFGTLFDSASTGPQFVFVGGKGGVGKTSTSSALAVRLADRGIKTLVISTDPAHSLGDCLDVDLGGTAVEIEGSGGCLFAMEVDTEAALERFKDKLRGLSSFKSKFGEHTDGIAVSQQQTTIALTDAVIKLGEAVVQPPAASGSRPSRMRVTGVQHVTGDNRSAARFRCRESWVIAQSLVLTQPDDNRGVQVLKSRVKR